MKSFFAVVLLGLTIALSTESVEGQSSKPSGSKPSTGSSGKSYGSGSKPVAPPPSVKPTPPAPPPSTKPVVPSTTPPSGKSYGSGSTTPTTPKVTTPSGKSYGSGSQPATPTTPTPSVTTPSGKGYGSGIAPGTDPGKSYGKGTSGSTDPPPSVGVKPSGNKFDSKAGQAQAKEESRKKFVAGTTPASNYTDPKGKVHTVDPKDQKIEQLRRELNNEKWVNRDLREREFYRSYWSRPVVVYHDPYSTFFWYWLLDRSIEQQAYWAYHHRYSMDAVRYNDLLARNAELAARVRALEAQNLPRNPTYQPTGMSDADLMYNKEYVGAAYNPSTVDIPPPVVTTHHPSSGNPPSGNGGAVLTVMLYIFLGLAIVALIVWLVFVKKW